MPTLYLMIGVPASGKSSYAGTLGAVIVSSDRIRFQHRTRSAETFAIAHDQVRSTLRAGRDVVLDATNLVPNFRAVPIAIAHEHGACVVACVMNTPLGLTRQRHIRRVAQGRRASLTLDKIDVYQDRFVAHPPQYAEGFDQIWYITAREDSVPREYSASLLAKPAP